MHFGLWSSRKHDPKWVPERAVLPVLCERLRARQKLQSGDIRKSVDDISDDISIGISYDDLVTFRD